MDEGVKERGAGEEETAEKHHALAAEYVGERSGGELDHHPGDRRGSEDQTEQLWSGAEVLGKARKHGAPGHLIPEASQEAGQHQCDERCHYCGDDVGREKPNVRPIVNCQSGAARLMPRRTPASRNTFFDVGCQMTPRSAELFGRWPCVLSPLTSPTARSFGCTGNSPMTPQIAKACRSSRSRPPPPFTCTVTGPTFPLTIPIASAPTPCSRRRVDGSSSPASIAKLTPSFPWRTPSFSTLFKNSPGSVISNSGLASTRNSPTASQFFATP